MTECIKKLDRKRKREFWKNKKSAKWCQLNKEFKKRCKSEKEKYFDNIVKDLKTSEPAQWYSKVKRMSTLEQKKTQTLVQSIAYLSDEEQAETIADHFAKISQEYDPLNQN